MLLILVAAIVVIVSSLFMTKLSNDCYGALIVLSFLLVIIGVTSPLSGYSESTLQAEYELMPLVSDTDTYVIKTIEETLICKHNKTAQKNESPDIMEYDSNVTIQIDNTISKPVLKIYSKKPKISLWTFALAGDKTEMVIYVPQENIID